MVKIRNQFLALQLTVRYRHQIYHIHQLAASKILKIVEI